MVDYLVNSYSKYLDTLDENGYIRFSTMERLLILQFIIDLLYNDNRCCISQEEYDTYDRALHCLFGSSCLTPYFDYSDTMGKLIERYRNTINICEKSSEDNDAYVIDFSELFKNVDKNTEAIGENTKSIETINEHLDAIDDLTIVVPDL